MSESSDKNYQDNNLEAPGEPNTTGISETPTEVESLDPAGNALAEALRISFAVLKIVMIAVLVFFAYSGTYRVQENERAVVLRFGRLKGTGPTAIEKPGLNWAWPYPLEEVIRIPAPTAVQTLNVTDFWYYETEREKVGIDSPEQRAGGDLQFIRRDGYSLTASRPIAGAEVLNKLDADESDASDVSNAEMPLGAADYNVVHSEWQIRYRITDPLLFVEHLWDGTERGWFAVSQFLRSSLAEAVIMTSASRTLHEMIWDKTSGALAFRDAVSRRMAQRVNTRQLGIAIELDLVRPIETPRQVKSAFDRVTIATLEAEKTVLDAMAKAAELISQARAMRDIAIARADARRNLTVTSARADADYLTKVLASITQAARQRIPDSDPDHQAKRKQIERELLRITVDELYQEMLREVMAKADETFVLTSSDDSALEWRLLLNRDASLGKGPTRPGQMREKETERTSSLTRPSGRTIQK
jgi:membrane protease subunit HflK